MTKSKDQIRCWQSIFDSIYNLCKFLTCIKPSYWRYHDELSEPLLEEKIELVSIEPYGNIKYSCNEIIYMDVDTINQSSGYVAVQLNNLTSEDATISKVLPPPVVEYMKFEDNDSSSSNSSGLSSSSDDDELMGYRHTRLYAMYDDKKVLNNTENL